MKKIFAIGLIIFSFFIIHATNNKINESNNKTVVNFSSWGSQSEVTVIKQIINDFEEKNPDIKINFIHIPQNYFQKIHLLFASALEPDVIFINNQYIQMYIRANLLEDLTPYFYNQKNEYFDEAFKCFISDNKLYALPRDISTLVIYYNKDILKKHNISSQIKLKNLEDLKNLAQELTTKDNFGINSEEDPLYWLYFLASNGAGALSDDTKSVIIDSKNSIDALNLYSDFINKYHIAPSKSQIGSMTTAQMFINGKLALYISGRWMVPKFRENVMFDWDITEFPTSDKNKLYIDSSGWAISKKSKNKKEAIKFVEYISSYSSINKIAQSGLIIPARKDSANALIVSDKNKKPHNSQIFISMIANTKPTPVIKNYSAFNDILKEKGLIILTGNHDAKDVFNQATIKKLTDLL